MLEAVPALMRVAATTALTVTALPGPAAAAFRLGGGAPDGGPGARVRVERFGGSGLLGGRRSDRAGTVESTIEGVSTKALDMGADPDSIDGAWTPRYGEGAIMFSIERGEDETGPALGGPGAG